MSDFGEKFGHWFAIRVDQARHGFKIYGEALHPGLHSEPDTMMTVTNSTIAGLVDLDAERFFESVGSNIVTDDTCPLGLSLRHLL